MSPSEKDIAVQQLIAEAEIGETQRILEQAAIQMLVLKGPHLANTIYEREADRVYGDLDLLVRPRDFDRAITALLAEGYVIVDHGEERKQTAKEAYNVPFRTPRGMLLELHRHFSQFDRFPLDHERLFAEAEEFQMGQVRARGLKPEHLLVHLIIHILKSYFVVERKHYQDIAVLSRKLELDWWQVVGLLKMAGATVGGWYALSAARYLYEARVPETIMQAIEPSRARKLWMDRFVHPRRFPVVDGRLDHMGPTQRRLALPLMDEKRRWVAFGLRYAWVRLQDKLGAKGARKQ